MEYIHFFIDFVLHIDVHLAEMVTLYGPWIYAILFLIIFCETGLVVTPFLPGDSLLFVAGALAALPGNPMNVHLIVLSLVIAAVLGDASNYTIGSDYSCPLRPDCTDLCPLCGRHGAHELSPFCALQRYGRHRLGGHFCLCRLFLRRDGVRAEKSGNPHRCDYLHLDSARRV